MTIATGQDALAADVNAALAARLQLLGGTMQGPIYLAADPTTALGAATKQYVDNAVGTGPASSGDWLNIKTAFGAKGDGVTNDSQAIQNAINGTPAGGALFWPAGTYVVTGSFAVNKLMTWVGAGRQATTIQTNTATTNTFTFNQCVNISDMGFTCGVTPTSGYMLTYGPNATRFRLKNFWMVTFFNGININGTSDVMLIDGQMFGQGAGGIGILYNGGEACLIDGLILQQGLAPGLPNSIGIKVVSGGMQLSNSEIMACGTGMLLQPTTGQVVCSMWVVNTAFDNCIGAMIAQPTGSGVCARNFFIGCWFSSSHSISGVTLNPQGSASIDGMDFVNCHVFDNKQHGFQIANANCINLSWRNCQIAGNTDYGISFFSGSSNFSIIGNRIGPYGQFGVNGTGAVYLGAFCSTYTIVDNDLTNGGIAPLSGNGVQTGNRPGISEIITRNQGYVDQNRSGQPNLPAGQTFVTVSHGLSGGPRLWDIQLSMLTGVGNPVAFVPFVTNVNASTFQINIGVPVGFTAAITWWAKLPCTP